jgi:hypothetical protein
MNFDFIEIGTSDFAMECTKKNKKGISIEPVKYYFDKIPNKYKFNVAISDVNGKCKVYYIPINIIEKYNLPNWIRGCNSMSKHHPTAIKYLVKNNLPLSLIQYDEVDKLSLKQFIDNNNINFFELLKIDTEGHDVIILNEYFKNNPKIIPNKIIFECNELTPTHIVNDFINFMENTFVFFVKRRSKNNVELRRYF